MYQRGTSLTAEITIGYNKGYNHLNRKMTELQIANIIDSVQLKAEEEGVIEQYISFVIAPAKYLYKQECGCPAGGENVFVLKAIANRKFVTNLTGWKMDVLALTTRLKERLQQSTVTVFFTEAEMYYDC